ncbi:MULTISPECIES: hypothetical protein [Cysteiniphilum]|uniref:Conjugal transfer protein TrbJ n=1 Tax=Cysteiniphilum litorale TaxID=2056700 RepID=A0A8J2Z4U9_9GAMM|nr:MULTISPECIES: hypothetical protein [Cysteiniphilum]GGF99144.1 hypothetical protein GCM10010995_15520 [Cysteiniphilum litorale]
MSIKYITLTMTLSMAYLQSFALGGDVVIDPTNLIQNTSTALSGASGVANQGTMIANQIEQLNNQRIMLQNSDLKTLTDYTNAANTIGNMASTGEALTYSTENINQRFNDVFGHNKKGDAQDKTNSRMQTVLDTTKGTLNSTKKQMGYMAEQSDGLNQIVNHSNSAQGTKAVLQGTNQLLQANAAQLQSINQSLNQMQSQQATIAAANASQEMAATKADQKFINYDLKKPSYEADDKFKTIPDFSTN